METAPALPPGLCLRPCRTSACVVRRDATVAYPGRRAVTRQISAAVQRTMSESDGRDELVDCSLIGTIVGGSRFLQSGQRDRARQHSAHRRYKNPPQSFAFHRFVAFRSDDFALGPSESALAGPEVLKSPKPRKGEKMERWAAEKLPFAPESMLVFGTPVKEKVLTGVISRLHSSTPKKAKEKRTLV